ncbi:Fanconi anemia group B protein [Kryptolebias marmoratus]|uniref:Fanconi anemia group B protein n=1 Tax=Kryptolebias marmoratus TaxID=37003 RepID=UPI0007F93C14|nr:Fanconi anemia group B protein [Kryptolebias marmoratus]
MDGLCSEGLHLLSHGGKIISFSCERDAASDSSGTVELIFRSFSLEPEGNAPLKAAAQGAVVISRKVAAQVDIVKCKCAIDVRRRVRTPCILVTKKRGDRFHYILLTLSSSNQLEPRIKFKPPYQMKGDVCILQGPTVLWRHEDSVFYTSLRAEGVRKIPMEMSHCLFGELSFYKGQVFVLGLQKPSDQSAKQSTSPTLGYFLEDGQVFDGTVVLPHPYLCITQCMLALSSEREGGVLKCAVIAATSHKQLVYFENGVARDACQLPYDHVEGLQVVNTGRNGCLFVVLFKRGDVCAVWKETFQIAALWSGVSSVHVDDFLGCGTDQMLLLFRDQGVARRPADKFLITDLCGISFSCGQASEALKTTPSPQENYLLTLQALESRLQSGLIVLQDLQRDVSVKEGVIQQSVQVLTDVLSGRETQLTQHEQEGLVALWDSGDESRDETADDRVEDSPGASPEPQIEKLWHRFTEDRMVVGVILTAGSAIPATGVSLSLLTETGQSSAPAVIQTQSQAFWLPACRPSTPPLSSSSSSTSAFAFSQPAAKRSRQHVASDDPRARRLAVTAMTKLAPLLTSGCVKCCVMLHYTRGADALSPVSKRAPVVLHCGQVAVDIHSVFQKPLLKNPLIKTDEVREDLLSLLTVLDRWVLHIDSPDYSLGDMDGWIQKRAGCQKVEVSPQYLLLDSPEPSAAMLLHWHQITPFQGELSIHSSQLQMLRFLDSLRAFLPASCAVRPVKSARSRSTAQTLALALENEVLSLRKCAASLAREREEGDEGRAGPEEPPEPGSVEGLRRCREAWRRDVERSRTRLSALVDVGKYREMIRIVSDVQTDGDLAALLYAQRTLFS